MASFSLEVKQSRQNVKYQVDKLLVGIKLVNPPCDKVKDINLDTTSKSFGLKAKQTPVVTTNRRRFQGHIIPIGSTDDVMTAIQSLCQDQRVAGSTHIMYAYRIGNESYNLSNFENDGELGGGREIMAVVDERQCFNHLVAVTRWYGGHHMGPS